MFFPRLIPVLGLLIALTGCSSDTVDGPTGNIILNDTTDNSGKADVIGGRQVDPTFMVESYLDGAVDEGSFNVTAVTDDVMSVEGPLIAFGPTMGAIQITIDDGSDWVQTVLRVLLFHRPANSMEEWTPITLTGPASYERDSESMDEGMPIDATVSYFETLTINPSVGEITFSADTIQGTVSAPIPFEDALNHEWAVFPIPVDSGWWELEGPYNYRIAASCDGDNCAPPGMVPDEPPMPPDIFADARNVDLAEVLIDPMAAPPMSYSSPSGTSPFGLGGTEFWQKWSEGHNPTYSYYEGSAYGQKCMQASAIRFEAIMADPPGELVVLRDNTNWDGRFFNWNDDYSDPGAFGSPSGSRLWAWRTGLIKWISQTGDDGTCYLPTRDLVVAAARDCLGTGDSADGQIEGCSAR